MITFKQFKENEDEHDSPWDKPEAPEIKPLHDKLKKHYDFPDEKHISNTPLKRYGNDSEKLNSYLWNKHKDPSHHSGPRNMEARMLSHTITQTPAPNDMTVHTGLYGDPRKRMNSNGIVHHPAFLSASLNPHIAKSFAIGHRHAEDLDTTTDKTLPQIHSMQIHIPEGSRHGAYVAHVVPATKEREFLIDKGKNLKIHHTDKHIEKTAAGYDVVHYIHHTEIVK